MPCWCDGSSASDMPAALSPARPRSPRGARGAARRAGPPPSHSGNPSGRPPWRQTPSLGAEGALGGRSPRPAAMAGAQCVTLTLFMLWTSPPRPISATDVMSPRHAHVGCSTPLQRWGAGAAHAGGLSSRGSPGWAPVQAPVRLLGPPRRPVCLTNTGPLLGWPERVPDGHHRACGPPGCHSQRVPQEATEGEVLGHVAGFHLHHLRIPESRPGGFRVTVAAR